MDSGRRKDLADTDFTLAGEFIPSAFLRIAKRAARVKGVPLREFLAGLPWDAAEETEGGIPGAEYAIKAA